MSESVETKNYSAFDAELTHQALNMRLFVRLLRWMRPYRITLVVSITLVVLAAAMSVLIPVVTGRVIIDTILVPSPMTADMPDYGLIAAAQWIERAFAASPLFAATVLPHLVGTVSDGSFTKPAATCYTPTQTNSPSVRPRADCTG